MLRLHAYVRAMSTGVKFEFPLSPKCLVDESDAKSKGFDSINAAGRRGATRRRA
jgi:hypothetical protein